MPSQLLHTLFGEDVIAEIHRRLAPRFGIVAGKALEKIQIDHRKTFSLGCQGPDIFYHSRRRRPVGLEYGTLLHRRGAGIFTAGLLKMGLPDPPPDEEDIRMHRREKGINALGVYALGFMTHAILDRQTHPYIVYKSFSFSPIKSEGLNFAQSHAFFERIIDVLMFKELRGSEIESWDQVSMLAQPCEKPPLGLKDLLGRALTVAFPERAGKDEKLSHRIENAFLDSAGFYHFTAPSQTYGKNSEGSASPERDHLYYIYPESLPSHIDFLNLQHRPWYYPAGQRPEELFSFPEVYANAVNTASDTLTAIIGRYLEEGFFPIREAAQAIGNGGLSIVDDEGIPCVPTRSDPLPLDEVFFEQMRAREKSKEKR